MITSEDFDFFLRHGYIEGLSRGAPMHILLNKFGEDRWLVMHNESNNLINGIIKIGFIEFHIWEEKISGISYRPDLPFDKKDFNGSTIPWILKKEEIVKVEKKLTSKKIDYKKYVVKGPLAKFITSGACLFGLEDCEHTFIDTEGGVTFMFELNEKTMHFETQKVSKYYDL